MQLKARNRLSSSKRIHADWLDQLDETTNNSIRAFVKKVQTLIKIKNINTDGYDNYGCEIDFVGKGNGSGSFDDFPMKDVEAMIKLAKSQGLDVNFAVTEDDHSLKIIVLDDN